MENFIETGKIEAEIKEELKEEKREFAKSRVRMRMIKLLEAKERLEREQNWYNELLAMSIDEICEKEHYRELQAGTIPRYDSR